ncbi:hypothetical protein [Cytobacillus firmus]|uniref:hypothetical protein n=1 Tax=Cytobacillus firmus TaxID=1399 RepID=UPI002494B964|nr:hypothetical protein [Cytobacillus firmus]
MRSLRLVGIIVIASASLLFGCSDKSVDQAEFPPEKTATAEVNGTEYPMEKGNYQWVRKKALKRNQSKLIMHPRIRWQYSLNLFL